MPFAEVNAQISHNVDQAQRNLQHKLEILQRVSKVESDFGTFTKDYKRPLETFPFL